MENKKTYFMHEDNISNVRLLREFNVDSDKVNFLKGLIHELGIASVREENSPSLKVPIQSIIREEVKDSDLDFSDIVPQKEASLSDSGFYESDMFTETRTFEKTLPPLPDKKEKKLPELLAKKVVENIKEEKTHTPSKIYSSGGIKYYRPMKTPFKKYGIIDPLIADKEVTKIRCIDLIIRVDLKGHKNLRTGLKFNKAKAVNKIINKISKAVGLDITEEEPLLDFEMSEGFRIHGNYGTDFIAPTFEMVRLKKYY